MHKAGYAKLLNLDNSSRAQRLVRQGPLDNSPSGPTAFLQRIGVIERTDVYWNEKLNLMDEFRGSSGDWRHDNEVDAFRHAYTSGLLSGTPLGVFAVAVASVKDKELMDFQNNMLGMALHDELARELGRNPTETEFALCVVQAVRDGILVIDRPGEGKDGWADRAEAELQRRIRQDERDEREMRELREWFENRSGERGYRNEPLPPSDREWQRARDQMRDGEPGGSYERGGGVGDGDSGPMLA